MAAQCKSGLAASGVISGAHVGYVVQGRPGAALTTEAFECGPVECGTCFRIVPVGGLQVGGECQWCAVSRCHGVWLSGRCKPECSASFLW
jgi:hypothetical protein